MAHLLLYVHASIHDDDDNDSCRLKYVGRVGPNLCLFTKSAAEKKMKYLNASRRNARRNVSRTSDMYSQCLPSGYALHSRFCSS